jgi:uncharacterized protein with PQ loop repeat
VTALAVIAATFGVLMGVAPLLQLRRILKLKSSRDISVGFFCVPVAGQFTWVVYGIALGNAAIIASNGAGCLANAAVLTAAVWMRGVTEGAPVGNLV